MSGFPLSTIRPDYQALRSQLQQELASKGAWIDLLPTATGQALIDFMASIGAFSQFSLESVLQEEFFDTQKFTSSTLAKARTLGVRLSRKIPAYTTVRLTRGTGPEYVPAYTQFEGNGRKLYNREAILFDGATQDVTLYCGLVRSMTTQGFGSPFQRFITDEADFSVSDTDVLVMLDGTTLEVTKRGLWHYQGIDAVQDGTTRDGKLVLTFGNDYYGTNPRAGSVVALTYTVCNGSVSNDSTFTGHQVKCLALPLSGVALSGLQGGADQPDANVYKSIGPHIYSSGDKSVTHLQYNARAMQYPGVVDALLSGQRYVAPTDRRYMNLVRVSLLTNTMWSDADWQTFVNWFYDTTMHNLELYEEAPSPRDFDTDVEVVCKASADLNEVKVNVEDALNAFYALGHGSLGRKIYLSDIYQVIRKSSADIHHVNVKKPTFNIIPNLRLEGLTGKNMSASAGNVGTLPQTGYSYWVTAVAQDGTESLPEQADVTVTNPGEYPMLTWDTHPYASAYRVYGRTKTGLGLLIETVLNEYKDFGTTTPGAGTYPTVDVSGVFFPRSSSLKVVTRYARDTVRT